AHQPHRRLPLAQQRQDRRGQVQAATTAATGLACFIFRFLRRPQIVIRATSRRSRTAVRALSRSRARCGYWKRSASMTHSSRLPN
ncbi:hypothetical protein F7R19_19230, partial [Cupriavidus pauculus]